MLANTAILVAGPAVAIGAFAIVDDRHAGPRDAPYATADPILTGAQQMNVGEAERHIVGADVASLDRVGHALDKLQHAAGQVIAGEQQLLDGSPFQRIAPRVQREHADIDAVRVDHALAGRRCALSVLGHAGPYGVELGPEDGELHVLVTRRKARRDGHRQHTPKSDLLPQALHLVSSALLSSVGARPRGLLQQAGRQRQPRGPDKHVTGGDTDIVESPLRRFHSAVSATTCAIMSHHSRCDRAGLRRPDRPIRPTTDTPT